MSKLTRYHWILHEKGSSPCALGMKAILGPPEGLAEIAFTKNLMMVEGNELQRKEAAAKETKFTHLIQTAVDLNTQLSSPSSSSPSLSPSPSSSCASSGTTVPVPPVVPLLDSSTFQPDVLEMIPASNLLSCTPMASNLPPPSPPPPPTSSSHANLSTTAQVAKENISKDLSQKKSSQNCQNQTNDGTSTITPNANGQRENSNTPVEVVGEPPKGRGLVLDKVVKWKSVNSSTGKTYRPFYNI